MIWKKHNNYGKVGFMLGDFDLIVWRDERIVLYTGAGTEVINFGKIPIEEEKEKAFNYLIDKLNNKELKELQKETQK